MAAYAEETILWFNRYEDIAAIALWNADRAYQGKKASDHPLQHATFRLGFILPLDMELSCQESEVDTFAQLLFT